jgi:trypsin
VRTARIVLTAALAAATVAATTTNASAVVGGSAVADGQYAFTASLQNGDFAFCGGSVIAPGWVLTAAHCVPDGKAAGLSVVLGTTDNSNGSGQRLPVSQVIVHPSYDPDAMTHDAALLRLNGTTSVAPIALAGSADDDLEAGGTPVKVTGWGDQTPIAGGGLLTTNRMRQVDLRVVEDRNCNVDGPTGVCAEALLKDSCQGDSGGPLFATKGGRPVQVGIVSYGLGCAVPEFPGVYSEVNNASIRSFIKTNTGV